MPTVRIYLKGHIEHPGHGLLATTHIVLKTAEGEKYDHAVKWGVPAVADR